MKTLQKIIAVVVLTFIILTLASVSVHIAEHPELITINL